MDRGQDLALTCNRKVFSIEVANLLQICCKVHAEVDWNVVAAMMLPAFNDVTGVW